MSASQTERKEGSDDNSPAATHLVTAGPRGMMSKASGGGPGVDDRGRVAKVTLGSGGRRGRSLLPGVRRLPHMQMVAVDGGPSVTISDEEGWILFT